MSGLLGIVRPSGPVDLAAAASMLRVMDARGPDARRAETLGENAFLGVTARGDAGPAWDRERRWCVAVDGEWTSLGAIRKELAARDELADEGPAGVAATLFAELGFERGMERLRGDAAVLAWDATERRLWAARDRTGTRPLLHATLRDGTVIVASEARAILRHPKADGKLDADALARLVVLGFLAPPHTPWASVRKLGPGCLARVDRDGLAELVYWREGANPAGAAGARYRWARSAGYAVELAVGQRAQGEIAVARSGGAYATAIAGAVAARRRAPPLELSVEGGPGRPVTVDGDPGLLDEVAAAMDVPPVDPAAVAWFALARAAGDAGCEALLTGVGGAELFGGPAAYLAQRAAALPGGRLVGRALGARGGGWARRQVRWRGDVLPAEEGDALWADVDALAAACPGDDPTGCALWLDRRLGLAEGALAVVDATCGAHGIAHRAPLADPDLVKLVAQIPVGHLVQVRRPRGLFEEAMAERLPDPPKHAPMALPFAAWLARGALPDDLAERLDGLADPDGTRRLVADFRAGRPGLAGRLWSLQMLARWRMG